MLTRSLWGPGRYRAAFRFARSTSATMSLLALVVGMATLGLALHRHHTNSLAEIQWSYSNLSDDAVTLEKDHDKSFLSLDGERERAIISYLAQRYRVSRQALDEFVTTAFFAGARHGLDPLLIIAVIAVESRFNPIAESIAGAQGLMQIIPRFHGDKLAAFGGASSVLDPRVNILVGSQVLKDYIRSAGDVSLGLRAYSGGPLEGENPYPARVMDEKRRLQRIVGPYTKAATPSPPRANP